MVVDFLFSLSTSRDTTLMWYKYLDVNLDNKLDWSTNTDGVFNKLLHVLPVSGDQCCSLLGRLGAIYRSIYLGAD